MTEFDKSFEKFLAFEKEYETYISSNLSETDTRSKILDKLLIDVLGWDEFDIEREGYVRVGYFDYELKTSTFKFVVEAKKNLVNFKLPEKGNEVKLKTINASNQEVIKQLREYLFEKGLSYGVITNGTQFIIGKFYGENWQEEKCYIFKSFVDIKNNFNKFYKLLSKEAVTHYGKIKISKDIVIGKTIIHDFPLSRKKSELVRNQLSNQLIPIINEVFEEIYNAGELEGLKVLKDCYVINEDVKKYNSELGSIFSDEPPTFDTRILPVQNTSSTHAQLKNQIFGANLPDPIILIGTAGAGKTTFIKYFSEIVLSIKNRKNRPFVYLDFRVSTSQIIKDTKHIYGLIVTQLEDNYPELNLNKINILKIIYKSDIEKKKIGVWSYAVSDQKKLDELTSTFIETKMADSLIHLQKVTEYLLQTCHKRVCVVFDNADQLDDADQKEVFLLGNAINRNLKALVLISLREGYFYKWRNKPPFNAYQSIVYHITAPPYPQVLKKRINYVMRHFKFEETKIIGSNKVVQFERGSLKHLFENLYSTLFNSSNSEVLTFLEQTSYPNTRQGLEIFKNFLLSGHSKISEYMSFSYGAGSGIPIWEFFKSIALDSNYYYEVSKSSILNLFNPSKSNSNHFTKIRILNFLNSRSLTRTKKIEFVDIEIISELFMKAGYSKDVVLEEIQVLFDYHLISTSEYSEDIEETTIIDINSAITITPVGVYYLKNLLGRFHYIDLILQDTPIYIDSFFNDLTAVFPDSDEYGNRDLRRRCSTTDVFISYLEDQEKLDMEFAKNFDNNDIIYNIIESMKPQIKVDIDRVEKALNFK
jgi:GTPase SAR1 family protein